MVVDQRTNTLIIRDTVDRVEGILRLIDQLDTPTPQVVIEARIVETTRDFSHQPGRRLGLPRRSRTPSTATTPGWSSRTTPRWTAASTWRARYNGILGFTFGDILDTFNLDFFLMAR